MIKLFGRELNVEEIVVGAFIIAPFYFVVGWWVVIAMPFSGLLWAMSGAKGEPKAWRRLGVPVLTTALVIASNVKWWALCAFIPAGFGVLTLGYGMPDATDKGSFLGRMYLSLIKNYKVADFATRITTYGLYWATFVVVASIEGRLGWLPILF